MKTNLYSTASGLMSGWQKRLLTLAAGVLLAPAAWAQAPSNDNCSGATALTVGTTCTPLAATNVGATASGTPAPSCGGTTTTASNDVWYSVVVPTGGAVTVATVLNASSDFDDTVLELYSGTCGSLTSLACNDDDANAADGSSSITLRGLTVGSTIYARVFGYGTTLTGTFGICASIPPPPAPVPANDECTAAVVLTPGTTCTPTSGTVAGATQTRAPILCAGFTAATAQDVWYQFTATATAHVITATGNFDGVMEVMSGTCTSLVNVGCGDASIGNNETLTLTGLTVGTPYYVRYYPYTASPTNGAFTICVTIAAPTPANDNPSGAIALTVGATCTPVNGTNAGATTTTPNGYVNPGVSPYGGCGIASNPKDVWYSFTTAASGLGSTAVTLQVTGATAGYIRLFSASAAAGPFTEIACSSGGANNTVAAPLTITTLTPNTTYYISVAGYGSADTQGAFTICAVAVPLNDAAVQVVYATGKAPVSAPQVVQAVVRNAGASALTNVPVTLNVTGATTFADGKVIPSLAAGATATVTFAAYTPAAVGSNTLTIAVPADGVNTNNTLTYTQAVTANNLAYIDGSQPLNATGIGVSSTTPNGILASKFTINSSSTIGEVRIGFPAVATTTSTYQVVILDASATGTPGTVLFTSPTQTRATAAGTVTVPVTGTVTVNGPFFVGVKEISGNAQIGYQVEDPLRPATHYFQGGGTTTWTDVSTTTFKTRLALEVGFSSRVLATNSAALSKSITMFPNPSTGLVTLDVRGANTRSALQVEVLNILGQVVHTASAQNNAENRLNLSNLSTGMYMVRITSGAEYTVRQLVLTK